jgi:hypothetical protein
MNKPNYYAIIPAEVRYSKKLTPNAKLLYAEITALCNMNGKCTASTDYFCRLYEVSRVSIQKWLKILEDNNYIKRILDQVKNYCILRKNNINAEGFIDFYESKGWQIGKEKMKSWKACVRTWERREKDKPQTMSKIDAQLNEYLKGKEYL